MNTPNPSWAPGGLQYPKRVGLARAELVCRCTLAELVS